jgi:hypothetical protein
MKKLPLVFALFSCGWAYAQAPCARPALKLYHDNQEVQVAGSPLVSDIKLVLTNRADCKSEVAYQFNGAQIILVRGKRALSKMYTDTPEVDISELVRQYQPGDRVFIEVWQGDDKQAWATAKQGQISDNPTGITAIWIPNQK